MNDNFRDIGRVANSREARSCVLVKGSDGKFYFLICAQGFVMSVNMNDKTSSFRPFPDGTCEYPYGSMGSRGGKLYFGAGKMFYEFDPVIGEYTFFADVGFKGAPWHAEAWSPFEAEDGMIYFGACPVTHLMGFNPKTREFTEFGVISEDEDYLTSQATDGTGWIYCGVGMRKPSIIALNLSTGEKRTLAVNDAPNFCGEIRLGTDGVVYGAANGSHHGSEYRAHKNWHRLYNGELCERVEKPFTTYYIGDGFDAIHCPFENPPKIIEQDLVDHELTYIHPTSGESVTLTLDYEVGGAAVSPMFLTSEGVIYGTTNHPIQLFTYDTNTDTLTNYGRKPFAKHVNNGDIGWGNICAYAQQGDVLGGAAYCGGFIARIDLTQPICRVPDDVNPKCEGAFSEIFRPRSSVAMPDGKTMIFGGFNVNGKAGGGLVVYDSRQRTCKQIKNEDLLPGHSVMAMVPLSDTCVLCGTSIESPCGGKPTANEGELFEYNLESGEIRTLGAPVPNAKSIEHMVRDASGIIHGMCGNGVYFAYDVQNGCVLSSRDISASGVPVRSGMAVDKDGKIYGLLTDGIYCVDAQAKDASVIAVPPCKIESGMTAINGKIYFASTTNLWEYTV